MVSQFRHYLNTDSQFQELRESYPGAARRIRSSRRHHPQNEILPDADGVDDEMADEDNDYEGMDTSQLGTDGQSHNPLLHPSNATTQTQGLLPSITQAIPMLPSLVNYPTPQLINGQPPQPSYLEDQEVIRRFSFTSFLAGQPTSVTPHLGPIGSTHASAAPIAVQSLAGSSSASQANGASTASMYHAPQHNGENGQPGPSD